jgi:hypothetical protein
VFSASSSFGIHSENKRSRAQRFFLLGHVTSTCHTRIAIFLTGIAYLENSHIPC